MNQSKAYIYSTNPLDSANGKWDYGLLKETFEKHKVEQIVVENIPQTDRAFVVIPGQGNAGAEEKINEQLSNIKRVVLFITGDESAMFDVDRIKHPNISIWIQYPHQKHSKYNRFFIGAPQHLKQNLPDYPTKKYDVYFGGQITHQRRKQLAQAMPSLQNALYKPTAGFAQGDTPKEYYKNLSTARIAPCPAGAQVVDTFRFFEAIEMLALPIGDLVDSKGREGDYFHYIFQADMPIVKIKDWNVLPNIVPDLVAEYPANMHRVVAWWLRYKRNFGLKIMEAVHE
jgi:hypothetical protein